MAALCNTINQNIFDKQHNILILNPNIWTYSYWQNKIAHHRTTQLLNIYIF
jgi:hypothetical protein